MTVFEKDSLEYDTKVVIFSEKNADYATEIYIYLQDLEGDGEIFFNVDYEIEYKNGTFESGNGIENLDIILAAYGYKDYKTLCEYFLSIYENDKHAFHKIIDDIHSKGISLSVDESEGFQSSDGFASWDF